MTTRTVYLAGARVRLHPSAHIGTGGEAEVFDLGDGRALKLFKGPDHPDLVGDRAQQCAARERLHSHQHKLADFPASSLPDRVIGPKELATERKRSGQIVGYAMALVAGAEHLYRYAEPRFRRQAGPTQEVGNDAVAILADLQETVARIHQAGVVIGDFNDLNVLTRDRRAYLIDADSFQYGRYPCRVFTARFVDPLLCQAGAQSPILARPYNPDSDWYAFAVMVMRSLLCVGPYGGVHKPGDPGQRIPHAARPLARKTVFASDVVYPRPAIHYSRLPDDLLDYLHRTFIDDARSAPPAHLLLTLRWTRCSACGAEHARALCPACSNTPARPAATPAGKVTVHGTVRAHELVHAGAGFIVDVAVHGGEVRWLLWDGQTLRNRRGQPLQTPEGLCAGTPGQHFMCHGDSGFLARRGHLSPLVPSCAADAHAGRDGRIVDAPADDTSGRSAFTSDGARLYWLEGGHLHARGTGLTATGATILGQVLRRQTRIFAGPRWGFGVYRAGALTVGFRFRPDARGIDDRVTMPRISGAATDWHAEIGHDRLWLFWNEKLASQRVLRCACIQKDGRLLATASMAEHDASDLARWLPSARGGCAVASYLFVPTDAGIVRVEHVSGRLAVTREFPDTAPFVDAGARLLASSNGLHVASASRITRLTLD